MPATARRARSYRVRRPFAVRGNRQDRHGDGREQARSYEKHAPSTELNL